MSGVWARACDSKDVAPDGDSGNYAVWAVLNIGRALLWQRHRHKAARRVEYAGAAIRAWRKSLPVKSEYRRPDLPDMTGDDLLWVALRYVGYAQRDQPINLVGNLRTAEAALRTWWKQQQEDQP